VNRANAAPAKVCPGCSARYPPDALFCPNDGSPLTDHLTFDAGPTSGNDGHDSYLGREISGHIEIQNLAGVGAMGRVYRAYQKGIDRDVAVKVLHRELSANQQLVARFHREAKVASRLQHPNVVQVHLAGQLPDGAMYIVMEYLDGLSLQSALAAARGPFPLERALHIALQICDAAGEAHSQGVVHRDIKPENVMLVRRGEDPDFVKVLDFGTARYISPEGAQGEAVGPAGDVYATATLLYQMLAGRTPFEGEQAVALLVQQIHDEPPPLRSLPGAEHVPPSLAALIMKNLSKSPADRAADARTFGRALVEASKDAGLSLDDLVPRSSLFVPPARLSDPGSPPVRASVSSLPRGPSPSSEMPRDPRPTLDLRPSAPPAQEPGGISNKTKLWEAPPAVAARLSPEPTGTPSPPTATPLVDQLETTLDETSELHAPPDLATTARAHSSTVASVPGPPSVAGGSTRVRTEPALMPPVGLNLPPPSPPAAPKPPPAPAPTKPVVAVPPRVQASKLAAEAERETVPARRLLGVVIVCLLLGMGGASLVLYQLGMFSSPAATSSLDDVVAHGEEALKHARWDTPPGDNVKDVTTEGLARWPNERRLKDLRARATDELVKEAVGRKFAGDLPAALHMAHLANELDPSDTTAQHLVDEYERATKKAAVDAASAGAVPSAPVAPPHSGSSHAPPPAGPVAPVKVAVESSLAHPHVGQPITFTARVSGGGSKSVDDPRFTIGGPGLAADTKLGALAGTSPGSFVATFTGFEPGKYEIAFDGKVEGGTVHATKVIMIEGDAPTPSSTPTLPSAIPSAHWL
jgi:serine/threonine-protein kinase